MQPKGGFDGVTLATEVTRPTTPLQATLQNPPAGLTSRQYEALRNRIIRRDPKATLTKKDLDAAAGEGVELTQKQAADIWEALGKNGDVKRQGPLGFRANPEAELSMEYQGEGSPRMDKPKEVKGETLIPKGTRNKLYGLGYTRDDIAGMSTEEAQGIADRREKKSKSEVPPGLRPTDGWKLHLNVARNSGLQREISAYLDKIGVRYKVGFSGGQTGKDITIYVGARDNAQKIAEDIDHKFGRRLGEATGDVLVDDTQVAGKVWGRFDVAGDDSFHQYGKQGVPILKNLMEWGPTGGIQPFSDEAIARSRETLENKYGEFFTGSTGREKKSPRAETPAPEAASTPAAEAPQAAAEPMPSFRRKVPEAPAPEATTETVPSFKRKISEGPSPWRAYSLLRTDPAVQNLLELGKTRGYVTEEEFEKVAPVKTTQGLQYFETRDEFKSSGVQILYTAPAPETKTEAAVNKMFPDLDKPNVPEGKAAEAAAKLEEEIKKQVEMGKPATKPYDCR